MPDLSYLGQTKLDLLQAACTSFGHVTQGMIAVPMPYEGPSNASAEAWIRFSTGEDDIEMPVVILPTSHAHVSSYMAHRAHSLPADPNKGLSDVMVVAPYISNKQADDLIGMRIPFLDASGNAYLRSSKTVIMITGREKQVTAARSENRSRSTTPKGLLVMFALATMPQLIRESYRTIAAYAGVSLNTVDLAVDDLIARRLVGIAGEYRRVLDPRRFMEEWVSLYPTRLRPKLEARRFTSGDPDWWRNTDVRKYDCRLGGEAAAEILTSGALKASQVTLYARQGLPTELMIRARMRPDPRGEVEVLAPFWPLEAEEKWAFYAHHGLTHPLLIYADLIASGDSRNHEIAETIYAEHLGQSHD